MVSAARRSELPSKRQPVPCPGDSNTGNEHRPLSAPVRDEPRNRERVLPRQARPVPRRSDAVDDPLSHGRGKASKTLDAGCINGERRGAGLLFNARVGCVCELCCHRRGPCVERRRVFPREIGASGEPRAHSRAEFLNQRGEQHLSHAHAGVRAIAVVRIVPDAETKLSARSGGRHSPYFRIGPHQRADESYPFAKRSMCRDPGNTACPRTASERKEHLLSLVIAGVRGEDRGSPGFVCNLSERRIPRVACRRFGPTARPDLDAAHHDRIKPKASCRVRSTLSCRSRSWLQAVVNHERARTHCEARSFSRERGRQREGIRAPGQPDEEQWRWPSSAR